MFYMRTIDAYAYNTVYSTACVDCHRRKVAECSGGCYGFKINEILALQALADKRLARMGEQAS